MAITLLVLTGLVGPLLAGEAKKAGTLGTDNLSRYVALQATPVRGEGPVRDIPLRVGSMAVL